MCLRSCTVPHVLLPRRFCQKYGTRRRCTTIESSSPLPLPPNRLLSFFVTSCRFVSRPLSSVRGLGCVSICRLPLASYVFISSYAPLIFDMCTLCLAPLPTASATSWYAPLPGCLLLVCTPSREPREVCGETLVPNEASNAALHSVAQLLALPLEDLDQGSP